VSITVERIAYKNVPVNVTTTGSVPSGYVDKAEEMMLDYDEIQITGPASVVSQITQAKIEVSLNDQTESVNQSFRYTLCDALGDPVDSELITVNVKEVNVKIPVQQVKVIKLKVNLIDGGGATAQTTTYEVDPGVIQVCGSKAALAELGNELVLGNIYLAEHNDGAKITMDIDLPSGVTNMSAVTNVTVTLDLPDLVTKTLTINREDIKLANVPEGMEAELLAQVLTITIRGPQDQIMQLDEEDITAVIDFAGAEPGTSYRRVNVVLGENFQNCGPMKIGTVSTTVRETE
jgi:YbbR domain-containing protein